MTEAYWTDEREPALRIKPRLPTIDGIFDLGSNVLIASHGPHRHIAEHLHDHLHHMHIRYGFEIPRQSFKGITQAALEVVMMIKVQHRVDCNPVFVGRGPDAEGVCLKIAGEDVHWVHNEEAAAKATELFRQTGRKVPDGYRFSGFKTSDLEERKVRRYSRAELVATVGLGLRCDQHFQATWIEPKDELIEPYDVIIGLSDDCHELSHVLPPSADDLARGLLTETSERWSKRAACAPGSRVSCSGVTCLPKERHRARSFRSRPKRGRPGPPRTHSFMLISKAARLRGRATSPGSISTISRMRIGGSPVDGPSWSPGSGA